MVKKKTGRRSLSLFNILLAIMPFIIGASLYLSFMKTGNKPIKVGILQSMTGINAVCELGLVDTVRMGIDEINAQGGILGRFLEPVVADGMSDPQVFAEQARRLIKDEGVAVIFGCWSSASRKAVKSVVEELNSLLIYSTFHEGLEESPNIIYTGPTANQETAPGATWCLHNLGKRIFLVGSDYIYPHATNEIIKDCIRKQGAELVGEEYIPLGERDVSAVIEKIKKSQPVVILSSVAGDTNTTFFKELNKAGLSADKVPHLSFTAGEGDVASIGVQNLVGTYMVATYLQNIRSQANKDYVAKVQERYGFKKKISESDQVAYISVFLWAKAVKQAQSTSVPEVKKRMGGLSMDSPGGVVSIDPKTHYAWNTALVGKMGSDGLCTVVWDSEQVLKPQPYYASKTKEQWDVFLLDLYNRWGQKWEGPKGR